VFAGRAGEIYNLYRRINEYNTLIYQNSNKVIWFTMLFISLSIIANERFLGNLELWQQVKIIPIGFLGAGFF
jgi:hypothetical protein